MHVVVVVAVVVAVVTAKLFRCLSFLWLYLQAGRPSDYFTSFSCECRICKNFMFFPPFLAASQSPGKAGAHHHYFVAMTVVPPGIKLLLLAAVVLAPRSNSEPLWQQPVAAIESFYETPFGRHLHLLKLLALCWCFFSCFAMCFAFLCTFCVFLLLCFAFYFVYLWL